MNYNSIFSLELNKFIEHKKALGYKYNSISIINKFDKFCCENKLVSKEISQDLYEKWIMKNETESDSMHVKKYSFIKNFTNYLLLNGYDKIYYNDEEKIKNSPKFIPYIYSDNEIEKIFQEIKKWNITTYNDMDKSNCLLLFTILYSCGTRISELLNLMVKNINIENKTITILNSKNNRSRIIPISDELNNLIYKFIKDNNIKDEDYLFQDKNGRKYKYNKILDIWNKIKINCEFENEKYRYRIHGFRHLFAIKCLNQIETKGYDIYVALPLLSKYLGHKSIKETEYYLKLTENYHNNIIQKNQKYCGNILEDTYE